MLAQLSVAFYEKGYEFTKLILCFFFASRRKAELKRLTLETICKTDGMTKKKQQQRQKQKERKNEQYQQQLCT